MLDGTQGDLADETAVELDDQRHHIAAAGGGPDAGEECPPGGRRVGGLPAVVGGGLDGAEEGFVEKPLLAPVAAVAAGQGAQAEAAAVRGGLDARYPKLQDFLERIHARPAYQRAIEKGGDAAALEQSAAALPEPQRPVVVVGPPEDALARVRAAAADQGLPTPAFDLVVGRGVLGGYDPGLVLAQAAGLAAPGGRLALAEVDRAAAQRLYRLVDLGDDELAAAVAAAEEAIYAGAADEDATLLAAAEAAGLSGARLERLRLETRETLPRRTVEGWFERGGPRPSYADHLASRLSEAALERVRRAFLAQLSDAETAWEATYRVLTATRG